MLPADPFYSVRNHLKCNEPCARLHRVGQPAHGPPARLNGGKEEMKEKKEYRGANKHLDELESIKSGCIIYQKRGYINRSMDSDVNPTVFSLN